MKREWYKKEEELKEELNEIVFDKEEIDIWYLGQCGFAIKFENIMILIDPVLKDIAENGKNIRLYEPPFQMIDINVDYVLCTHNHIDHMNKETINEVLNWNENAVIIAPEECCLELEKCKIGKNNLLRAKNNTDIYIDEKTIRVQPFILAHPKLRYTKSGGDTCLGYDIDIDGFRIVHFGDTYICDELIDTLDNIKKPDVMMISINGRDYFREKKNIIGNTNIREAIELASYIETDTIIPMHFDMIEGNTENPSYFINELYNSGLNIKFRLPLLGEKMVFKRSVKK